MARLDESQPAYDGARGLLHGVVQPVREQATLGLTTQLALECVLIWERASIACRYGDKVVVLEPGMRILVASDPAAAGAAGAAGGCCRSNGTREIMCHICQLVPRARDESGAS